MTDIGEHSRFIHSPNNETPMLLRYRAAHGGTLILEYPPIVTRASDATNRYVDAILLRDTPSIKTRYGLTPVYDWTLATPDERIMLDALVKVANTEVLQAKNFALGPYLLGQAHFSPRLMGRGVGVAIAGPSKPDLVRIALALSVKVVQDPLASASKEPRSHLVKRDAAAVEQFHRRVGGGLVQVSARSTRGLSSAGLVVDAIILPDKQETAVGFGLESIRGERAIAVCSTNQRLGMYVMGAAICAKARLLELGAAQAEVTILCKKSDPALAPLLGDHLGISVVTTTR